MGLLGTEGDRLGRKARDGKRRKNLVGLTNG